MSESPESTPPVSYSGTPNSDRGVIVAISIAVIATVFSLFFVMGFFSAWLKSEGDWMALVMRGLKLGASGSLGVVCIGISAKSWQRLPVPAWLPATASFAVGFFVMNGMGELLDGRYENILRSRHRKFRKYARLGLDQAQSWTTVCQWRRFTSGVFAEHFSAKSADRRGGNRIADLCLGWRFVGRS